MLISEVIWFIFIFSSYCFSLFVSLFTLVHPSSCPPSLIKLFLCLFAVHTGISYPSAAYSLTVGTSFSLSVTTTGTAPSSYSFTNLPPGLTGNTANGQISGTPTVALDKNATITASYASGAISTVYVYFYFPSGTSLCMSFSCMFAICVLLCFLLCFFSHHCFCRFFVFDSHFFR